LILFSHTITIAGVFSSQCVFYMDIITREGYGLKDLGRLSTQGRLTIMDSREDDKIMSSNDAESSH
jgi:hypothetical protein